MLRRKRCDGVRRKSAGRHRVAANQLAFSPAPILETLPAGAFEQCRRSDVRIRACQSRISDSTLFETLEAVAKQSGSDSEPAKGWSNLVADVIFAVHWLVKEVQFAYQRVSYKCPSHIEWH
jgi:hypothetical protein